MTEPSLGTRLALVLLPVCAFAAPMNIERGAAIYAICGACHGARGEGIESLSAPPLAGQQAPYLLRQLEHFHAGVRPSKEDIQAQEMRHILTTVSKEDDWQSVIAFVKTLPGTRQREAFDGDIARGREIYASCAACHGAAGQGNEALEAPNLSVLPAWYVRSQLEKYRDGLRGGSAGDRPGNRMRAIAVTLHSDADVAAVTAYIVNAIPR